MPILESWKEACEHLCPAKKSGYVSPEEQEAQRKCRKTWKQVEDLINTKGDYLFVIDEGKEPKMLWGFAKDNDSAFAATVTTEGLELSFYKPSRDFRKVTIKETAQENTQPKTVIVKVGSSVLPSENDSVFELRASGDDQYGKLPELLRILRAQHVRPQPTAPIQTA